MAGPSLSEAYGSAWRGLGGRSASASIVTDALGLLVGAVPRGMALCVSVWLSLFRLRIRVTPDDLAHGR